MLTTCKIIENDCVVIPKSYQSGMSLKASKNENLAEAKLQLQPVVPRRKPQNTEAMRKLCAAVVIPPSLARGRIMNEKQLTAFTHINEAIRRIDDEECQCINLSLIRNELSAAIRALLS
jgi:hypothetical protein